MSDIVDLTMLQYLKKHARVELHAFNKSMVVDSMAQCKGFKRGELIINPSQRDIRSQREARLVTPPSPGKSVITPTHRKERLLTHLEKPSRISGLTYIPHWTYPDIRQFWTRQSTLTQWPRQMGKTYFMNMLTSKWAALISDGHQPIKELTRVIRCIHTGEDPLYARFTAPISWDLLLKRFPLENHHG